MYKVHGIWAPFSWKYTMRTIFGCCYVLFIQSPYSASSVVQIKISPSGPGLKNYWYGAIDCFVVWFGLANPTHLIWNVNLRFAIIGCSWYGLVVWLWYPCREQMSPRNSRLDRTWSIISLLILRALDSNHAKQIFVWPNTYNFNSSIQWYVMRASAFEESRL